MFEWFKPKNKKNVVIPSPAVGPLRGQKLLDAFTTEDEPKVRDFPKEKYDVYWETFIDAVPGGYEALVRFYSFKAGVLFEKTITTMTVGELKKEVNQLILATMAENKKV
jgi:hypothetical protein